MDRKFSSPFLCFISKHTEFLRWKTIQVVDRAVLGLTHCYIIDP
jgi:hypothetical protein